jgi:colanic acid/amylovoran biosynthesis glycosyltransferase
MIPERPPHSGARPAADANSPVPENPGQGKRLRVAYLVSRFPHVSETFIARELDAVSVRPGIELELLTLFPPAEFTVHPRARRWLSRLRRPRAGEAAAGIAWWVRRRPARLAASVALVISGYVRRPALLARALATLPIAAAHARGVQRRGVDHVHAHYATYPLLAAWFCHRLTGVPYSVTVHAHDIFVDRSFLKRRLADAAFIAAISEYNRRSLARDDSSGATPVHVVRCGIEPEAYRFRRRAPAPGGPVRALCVASLQEYKGHRVLLEALAGAGRRLARIQLDLVGSGPLRADLEEFARKLGLQSRVCFHGSLSESTVTEMLGTADLFVLPSVVARNGQMEGLPVALMEALAAGAPVVATRLSGIPEIVRDGETGLLAEPGSPEDLARALEAVLNQPAAAQARAEAGRRLVEREYDVRRSAALLAHLFLGEPNPGGISPSNSARTPRPPPDHEDDRAC